ncbi:MAG: MATE family efflux transporter [Acidimicrobiia bacterium]
MRVTLSKTDKAILGLAVPALGSLAIDPLLTLADTAFVARLGTAELAALGVDAAILTFAFFLFNFLASVVTPLVARALGKGEHGEAGRWVGDALLLAVGLGLLVTVILLVFAPFLVDVMGAGPEVAGPAISYLRIRALSTVAVLVVTVGHGAFRGHKDTVTPLKVALVVNGLNLILDPVLMFGVGLGLEGAAIATVVAQFVGAILFMRLIVRRGMAVRPSRFTEALPSLFALGKNGVMLTARTALLLMAFTVAASTATRIGTEEIASHQLVAQLFLLSALLADAFAIAAQAMVAETAGAGDIRSVNELSRRLVGWGMTAGIVLAVFVGVARYGLPLLTNDAGVGQMAVSAGGVAAIMEPVAATVFVADGIFLGFLALGTMVISTGLGAAVAIAMMTFTSFGDDLNGIWWALAVMMVVRGAVFAVGYRRSAEIAVSS